MHLVAVDALVVVVVTGNRLQKSLSPCNFKSDWDEIVFQVNMHRLTESDF